MRPGQFQSRVEAVAWTIEHHDGIHSGRHSMRGPHKQARSRHTESSQEQYGCGDGNPPLPAPVLPPSPEPSGKIHLTDSHPSLFSTRERHS